MRNRMTAGLLMGIVAALVADNAWAEPAPSAPAPASAATAPATIRVNFDRDIQPLLARCMQCHGQSKQEAGLKLTDLASASAELDSGSRAIVPGDPDASELLARVADPDPDVRMPPKGDPLTAEQIARLRRWIAAGAPWPAHWAYRPLVLPPLPQAPPGAFHEWPRTAIDQFVLAELNANGLEPAPEADKRTWLRRVSYDLVGLPPTIDQSDAFLSDDAPGAYERVVDRLLASPRYGERWARHWMDVVHYAETHGNDQDRPRENAWPYRDYLIRSLNADKPYARMVQEQLAGDALFPGDTDALVALGFLATGPWDESSLRDIREDTIDREIARYLDRDDMLSTAMSTFVSSTVHCARCHDHKFDPIKQEDYYRLQAVFAGVDKAEHAYDPDPEVSQKRQALMEQQQDLPALRAALDPALFAPQLADEVAAWEQELAAGRATWTVLHPQSYTSSNKATLTRLPDDSILSEGVRPDKAVYTIVADTELKTITGLRLELLTDDSLPHKGPGRQDNGNLHLSELNVSFAPRGSDAAAEPVVLQNPQADFNQQGWAIDLAIDGKLGTAWGIYPEVGRPHRAVFELKEPIRLDGGAALTFVLEQGHGQGHVIGRLRLSVTDAQTPLKDDALPEEVSAALAVSAPQRTRQQQAALAANYLGRKIEEQLAALPPQAKVYIATNDFQAEGSFRPAEKPRTIHLLHRGDVTQPGPEMGPGTLACVPGLEHVFQLDNPQDEASRRAALARWMSDPRNVLTWRSIVNRVWHYHFGRGLVDTPNDFGKMGSPPSHPELLDWLAVTFRDSGGSLKALHRLIVLSAVYRQSSQYNEGFARRDADNRLLWRFNRLRLDAEEVRDSALQASGKLDLTMGGPSARQFIQKPGVHVTPVVDYLNFDVDSPASCRRSVYRFVFRTLPDPFMESLDCADASQLTPVRNTSVTPLQALAMWNNKFMVRQCEHLAERLAREAKDLPEQIRLLYRLTLAREPTTEETAALAQYAAIYGLANTCHVVLNSNEFMFIN